MHGGGLLDHSSAAEVETLCLPHLHAENGWLSVQIYFSVHRCLFCVGHIYVCIAYILEADCQNITAVWV